MVLGLQVAATSCANGTGLGGLALVMCLGLLLPEGEMVSGSAHTASPTLSSQHHRATAPPAQQGGHRISTSFSGFGDLAPRNGEVKGESMVAFIMERVRLWKKSWWTVQRKVIYLDECCCWKDIVQKLSQHGWKCHAITLNPDLFSYGWILLLCKAMSILVTMTGGIRLLARCWKRYRSQRVELWPEPLKPFWEGSANYTECAICLQVPRPGTELKVLSCSHSYHRKCIDRWHRVQPGTKTCPLCLRGVTTVTLVYLSEHSSKKD